MSLNPQLIQGTNSTLTIGRQFGSFALIRVYYQTVQLNVSGSAIPGKGNYIIYVIVIYFSRVIIDYISMSSSVDLTANQASAIITISALPSLSPALDKYFTVQLTSVALISSSDPLAGSALPILGNNIAASVTIPWNNDAHGRVSFSQPTITSTVVCPQLPLCVMTHPLCFRDLI